MALATASAQIADEPDDAEVARIAVEQAAQLLRAGDVRLALLDHHPDWLVLRQALGRAAPHVGTRQPSGEGVLGQVTQSGEPFLVADLAAHPLAAADPDAAALGSVMAVPLRFKGEPLGALQSGRAPDQPPFTPADQLTLQLLADLAAARLGATRLATALRGRALELAMLDPAWRPPPDQAGEFIVVITPRGQIVDVDEAACRFLDYPREALLKRTLADISPLPPGVDEARALRPLVEQVLAGKVVAFEGTVQRRDGGLLPVRVHLQAFASPQGPVIRGVAHDLSREKRAQVEALQADKMRLLREVGSGVAHEINSPLAVVVGNAEMLLDETTDPEQRALLAPILEAALRIAAAVQGLQEFARPMAASAWIPVDLSRLALETVDQARPIWEAKPQAEGRSIRLRLEANPAPTLRANPVELQEALRELLANAVEALPHGGTIVVRTEDAEGQVLLTVADDGVGMSEQVRQRCLDPFFTTRRPGGTGLGLTHVYETVLRHRGQLQVESAQGGGTRVTISLPLALPE